MPKYYRENAYLALVKERSYRTPTTVKDAAVAAVYVIDKQQDEEVPFAETNLERVLVWTLGSGTRNADHVHEGGYPPADETLDFVLQTAKLLYGVEGTCDTVGVDTAETGLTVASGGGTATITISGKSYTVNQWAGYYCEVTAGDQSGDKYHIVSNTADTLTFDITTQANLDGDTVKIVGPPFTKTITEAQTLPSFALHGEKEHSTDANSIRQDLLGVIINEWSGTIEAPGPAPASQSVSIIGAKTVQGSDIARPTTLDGVDFFKYCHVKTNNLAYNSANLLDNHDNDRIEFTIANNAELRTVEGDCYASRPKEGGREYTIILSIYPEDKTIKNLRNTPIENYVTDLDYTVKLSKPGLSYQTPVTDVVLSGGGTATLTLTTGGLTPNAYDGAAWLKVTAGDNVGHVFYIVSNAASTVTLEAPTPSNIDGDGIEIIYARSIQFAFDKLFVNEYPESIASKDDHESKVDLELKQGVRGGAIGSLTIVNVDELGLAHFEGSDT